MLVQPLQNFETGFSWHFDVSNDDAGKGEHHAILVQAGPAKIIDGFLTVLDELQRVFDTGPADRQLNQMDIIFVVLRDQDGLTRVHLWERDSDQTQGDGKFEKQTDA